MKRGSWLRRAVALSMLLLIAPAGQAQSVAEEQAALARAKAQSILAEARAARLEAQARGERDEADAARAKAAAVAARIQSAEADIDAAETRIRLIARLRAEQRARLAAKQEPGVRLVAALQTLARRPPALALVQPGSVADLVHVRAVLATTLPILEARTAGLRAEIARGRQLEIDAKRALAALAQSQQRLVAQRAELVRVANQHRLASQQIGNSMLAEQDRAIALGETARDIGALIDDLSRDAAVRNRLAALPGPVLRPAQPGAARPMPVDAARTRAGGLPYRLPVTGRVVTGLGEISAAGVRARGLTLATRAGALIVAPSAGRIAFAAPYRGYGKIIIIDHGNGWTSLITSVAALDVSAGENVLQGSPIGRAGNDRPSITVELRHNDQPVDITKLIG